MKVTYFGTTTLLFDDGKDQILFDCHFTRPSLPDYIRNKPTMSDQKMVDRMFHLHKIERLSAIFISHSHHDHVMDAPYAAKKSGAVIYGSSSVLNVGRGQDVPEAQLKEYSDGSEYTIGDFRIRIIKSLHSKPTILNNDLGETIDAPLKQPVGLREYKEGGSYDFYIEHPEKKVLIRPSFNYIEHQLDGIRADVLFLGVAGLGKADQETEKAFFRETVAKVKPGLVIPVHWDNFFSPLSKPAKGMPAVIEKTENVFFRAAKYCESKGIDFIVQIPRTSIHI